MLYHPCIVIFSSLSTAEGLDQHTREEYYFPTIRHQPGSICQKASKTKKQRKPPMRLCAASLAYG